MRGNAFRVEQTKRPEKYTLMYRCIGDKWKKIREKNYVLVIDDPLFQSHSRAWIYQMYVLFQNMSVSFDILSIDSNHWSFVLQYNHRQQFSTLMLPSEHERRTINFH